MKTTLTITQIIEEWLSNADVLPITKQSYRNKTNLWFRYLLKEGIDVRSAKRIHVLNYKHCLENNSYSQLTVNSYITAVKLFYGYCESMRYCENISVGIRGISRYKGHRKSPLTVEQAYDLLGVIDVSTVTGKRDKLMICLMLFAGLRTCEVQRINICDFDLCDGIYVLTIQRKGRREKAETISVTQTIMDLFEDYTACRGFTVTDPLFVSRAGKHKGARLTRSTISEIVKSYLRRAGLDRSDLTAHSLRHTCGSLLVEQGTDIETVKDIMGHTSTTTTRIYVQQAQQKRLIKNSPISFVEDAVINAK